MVNTNQLLLDSYLFTLNKDDNYYLKEEVILEGFDLNKIQASFDKNLKNLASYLKDNGLSLDYLKTQSKKISKFAKKAYDSGMTPEKAAQVATNKFIDPVYKKVLVALKVRKEDDKTKLSKKEQLAKSVSLFALVFMCNTFVKYFLVSSLVPFLGAKEAVVIGGNLGIIIMSPLIEELTKRHAIKQKYPWVYAWTFFGLESLYFFFDYIRHGKFIPKRIMIRLVSSSFHFIWMFIQKFFDDRGTKYNKEWISWIGFIIAFTLHMFTNFVAITSSSDPT
jgi:hypothetical protein